MVSEEEFVIGSVISQGLCKGILTGYGIFVTNKQIIGIHRRAVSTLPVLVGVIGAYWEDKANKEAAQKTIAKLNQEKDFGVNKENIVSIELKKPTRWRHGHLIITSDKKIKVKLVAGFGDDDFKKLKELLVPYKPGVLKIID